MEPLEICVFLLRSLSVALLACGAWLCITHWRVLKEFRESELGNAASLGRPPELVDDVLEPLDVAHDERAVSVASEDARLGER